MRAKERPTKMGDHQTLNPPLAHNKTDLAHRLCLRASSSFFVSGSSTYFYATHTASGTICAALMIRLYSVRYPYVRRPGYITHIAMTSKQCKQAGKQATPTNNDTKMGFVRVAATNRGFYFVGNHGWGIDETQPFHGGRVVCESELAPHET